MDIMSQTIWETRIVKVADLFLDEANVRLDIGDRTPSQDALIHDLFVNQGAYDLAQHIANHSLFQHELPIVIEEHGRLVVIEGNRRIAALKAIYQPNLMPSYASRLEQLKKGSPYVPITQVEVKIAPNRAAVMQLLASTHTTESRKPWATLRQAYFYYAQIESKSRTLKQLIDEYPNVDVPKFVRMWQMHRIARSLSYASDEEASKVANQQNFPITTLERIYDNDSFQKEFGVSFNSMGKATITSDRASFEQAFKRVIQDVVNREVTSRTLNKSEEVKKYIDRIEKPKFGPNKKSLDANSFKPLSLPKRERIPKGLVPKDIVCTLKFPGLVRVLEELKNLDYRKFPNASHDLLRTFLECSLKAYFAHKSITVPSKGAYTFLNDALAYAEVHFKTENMALVQPIKIIRATTGNPTKNYLYSADFLNAVNHNPSVFSTGDHVKDAWDQMENIIRYILDPK